jgi:hypothetical protein
MVIKKCEKGKILNPTTNRCVDKHGLIGKKISQGETGKRSTKISLKNRIKNEVFKAEEYEELYDIPFKIVSEKSCKGKQLKILITNTPCNGFGDLIFAWKLSKILKKFYGAEVKIATTLYKGLITLGEDPKNIYKLASKNNPNSEKGLQCRKYGSLDVYNLDGIKKVDTDQFDIFLDAPVMADFIPDIKNIRKMIPSSTLFNTFFFSEYNDELDKGFDFNTGVGEGRDGLFFLPKSLIEISTKNEVNLLLETKKYGNFAVAYIADIEEWENCIHSFTQMIAAKYTYPKFQLVCPNFAAEILSEEGESRRYISPYYGKVVVVHKNKDKIIRTEHSFSGKKKGGTFYVRGDIFPIPNKKMMGILKYSVDDILLTGDQSISDALSCCESKNIFYQIAPWKENLGHQLAKLMPQKYLLNQKTSCGSLKAIKYHSDYHNFVEKWSFIKRAKPKLDEIICFARVFKSNNSEGEFIREYVETVKKHRSVDIVEKKLFS